MFNTDVVENRALRRENERLRDMIATMGKAMEDVIRIKASAFYDGPRNMKVYRVEYALADIVKRTVRSQDALCQMIIDHMAKFIRDDFDGVEVPR